MRKMQHTSYDVTTDIRIYPDMWDGYPDARKKPDLTTLNIIFAAMAVCLLCVVNLQI
jgi:hypothetical protein